MSQMVFSRSIVTAAGKAYKTSDFVSLVRCIAEIKHTLEFSLNLGPDKSSNSDCDMSDV